MGKRSWWSLSSFQSLSVVWSSSTARVTTDGESFSGGGTGGWWSGSAERWRRREERFGGVWGLRKRRSFDCFDDTVRAALIFSVSSQRKDTSFSKVSR